MDVTKWLDWMKLPTKTLAGLSLVLGILVFSSESTLNRFGLTSFVSEYRAYLGIGFLATVALTLVNCVAAILKFVYQWIVQAYLINIGKKRLSRLTPKEKRILQYYIHNQTRSQTLPVQDGTVTALQEDNIIIRGSSLGSLRGFDFIIQPWAWEYLDKRPELLD